MKRSLFFALVCLFFIHGLYAQHVDSIRVEQAGDLLKVHYKILNSKPSQVFRVTVFCSINGGLQSVINSLSGDFGDNVVGGRSDYMVLWDVLKDVDEVNSVDFYIRAELMKDYLFADNESAKNLSKRRIHMFLVAGGPGPKFGGKIGYMESWGIAAMYATGGKLQENSLFDTSPVPYNFAASINLTKRIVNAENFKIHLFAGPILSNFMTEDAYGIRLGYESFTGIEVGLISSIHNFTFSFGLGNFKDEKGEGVFIRDDEIVGNTGIGWRF